MASVLASVLVLAGAQAAQAYDPPGWWKEGASYIKQLKPTADCDIKTDEFGYWNTLDQGCDVDRVADPARPGSSVTGECYTAGGPGMDSPILWCIFDLTSVGDASKNCDYNADHHDAWTRWGGPSGDVEYATLAACVQAAFQATPDPEPTPEPEPEPDLKPVAGCDVYTTPPGSVLSVTAARGLLVNDTPLPNGGLRPQIVQISFGRDTHPYKVNADGSFKIRTTKRDKRLVLTYTVTSGGKTSAPTTALIIVTGKAVDPTTVRCADGSAPPARGLRGFLDNDCTGMSVTKHTKKIKRKGINGTLTYGISKPAGDNLCWDRGYPTAKDKWTVKNKAWVSWKGTPKKPQAIGLTDEITVNGTSLSFGLPPSLSFEEEGDGVSETVENAKASSASIDYLDAKLTLKGFSSSRISHVVRPWVKIKGSKILGPSAGDHNCVKFSLSGYYWGESYANCF